LAFWKRGKSRHQLEIERLSKELEDIKKRGITREEVTNLVQKTTISEIPEIFSKLEQRVLKPPPVTKLATLYQVDALIFIQVETLVNQILSGTFTISGQNPDIVKKYQDWWAKSEIEDALEYPVRDAILGGWGFLELAKNKRKSTIVRLIYVTPVNMDWQRDGEGEVALDKDGLPKGWEQTDVVEGAGTEGKEEAVGKFPRNNIFALKFWGLDPYTSQTPFASGYKDEIIFLNIREALGEATFRHGFPLPIAEIGDEAHDPTPEAMKKVDEDLQGLGSLAQLSVPYWYKIRFERPGDLSPVSQILETYGDIVFAGTGIPKGVMMGTPGRYGGALDTQVVVWETMVQALQKRLCRAIRNQIFKVLATLSDFRVGEGPLAEVDIPNLQIVTPIPAQKLSKARRISMLGRAGMLTWDKELEEKLRIEEGFPITGKDNWERLRIEPTKEVPEQPLSSATQLERKE